MDRGGRGRRRGPKHVAARLSPPSCHRGVVQVRAPGTGFTSAVFPLDGRTDAGTEPMITATAFGQRVEFVAALEATR